MQGVFLMSDLIRLVATPAGIAPDGGLNLNVLVMLNLDSGTRLGETPMADWPARLADASFSIRLGDLSTPARAPTVDSALWRGLFPGDLLVRAMPAEQMSSLFASYDAPQLANMVEAVRAEEVEGGSERMALLRSGVSEGAGLRTFTEPAGAARKVMDAEARMSADRQAGTSSFRLLRERDADDLSTLADFGLFHAASPVGALHQNADMPPERDFHQLVTLLNDHPAILRRLGLLLKFRLDARGAAEGISALSVEADFGIDVAVESPRTATRLSSERFTLAARAGPDAMLALGAQDADAARYMLVNYDLDAAGMQLSTALDDENGQACVLRTVGVSILEQRRAERLHGTVVEAATALSNGELLHAEDLTRGLRIDVQDHESQWRSLHRRIVHYAVAGQEFDDEDEGTLIAALAQKNVRNLASQHLTHDPSAAIFLGEQIAHWKGWSLAVPPPGQIEDSSEAPSTALFEHVITVPPGSLPRLRFGRDYRFRARRVDLAGFSIPIDQAHDDFTDDQSILPTRSSPPWRFLRHEPLAPPEPIGPASAAKIDRLVVRDMIAGPESMIRWGPPDVAVAIAEWAGKLEAAFGPTGNPQDMLELASQEKVPDPYAASLAVQNCPGIARGQLARVVDDKLQFEALPDPEAPGTIAIPFAGSWPTLRGVDLLLAGGDAAPHWDAESRRLTVTIPAGKEVEVMIITLPSRATLFELADIAGNPDLVERALVGLVPAITPRRRFTLVHAARTLPAPEIVTLAKPERKANSPSAWFAAEIQFDSASTGGLRLEASWQDVPDLLAPDAAVPVSRAVIAEIPLAAGATPVTAVSLTQTGQIGFKGPELAASHDLIECALSDTSAKNARASTIARQHGLDQHMLADQFSHLHAAMAIRPVDIAWTSIISAADALSTAANSLTEPAPDFPGDPVASFPVALLRAFRDVAMAAADVADVARAAIAKLDHRGIAYPFGDGRSYELDIRPVATGRFAAYFAQENAPEALGPAMRVIVPASARPRPPKICDMVPIFLWSRQVDEAGNSTSVRSSGLRLFLERPWLSSGPGELLAVLYGSQATRWARDPLMETMPLPRGPELEHARGTLLTFKDLVMPHSGSLAQSGQVGAAAYPVSLDETGLAFADIGIDPGDSYAPFIRLCLARLQPNAIAGMELSEAVAAEPIQLPPNRKLVITRSIDLVLDLSGPASLGVATADSPLGRTLNRVRARFQRRIAGTVAEAGWIDDAAMGSIVPLDPGSSIWRARAVQLLPGPARLLVEEHELWPSDTDEAALSERLIYAETVAID